LEASSREAGAAAELAASNKLVKYAGLSSQALTETWCTFWGDGVGALAPQFFMQSPKMRNWGRDGGGLTAS